MRKIVVVALSAIVLAVMLACAEGSPVRQPDLQQQVYPTAMQKADDLIGTSCAQNRAQGQPTTGCP